MRVGNKRRNSFRDQLINDEEILWEGAPAISFFHYLRLKGAFKAVIVYWLLFGFVFAFLYPVYAKPTIQTLLLTFLMIPISIFLGVYYLIKAFRDYRRYGLASYAVTNKRVFIQDKASVVSVPINSIPSIVKLDAPNGLGTISFQVAGFPVFYRIKDADHVHKLIAEQQATSK